MPFPQSAPKARRWSYEAVYNLLNSSKINQKEFEALSEFFTLHTNQFKRCWQPFDPVSDASAAKISSSTSQANTKIFDNTTKLNDVPQIFLEDAAALGAFLDVDQLQMLEFIMIHTESHCVVESREERIRTCITLFYKEWRFMLRCLSKLILLGNSKETREIIRAGNDNGMVVSYDSQMAEFAAEFVTKVLKLGESTEFWANIIQVISYKLLGPVPSTGASNSFLDSDDKALRLFDTEFTLRCIELVNLYISFASVMPTHKNVVVMWMGLAANTEMFTFFIEDKAAPAASDKLRALCSTAVIAAFDLELKFAKEPLHFTKDPSILSQIEQHVNTIVKSQFGSSLIVLVWALTLEQLAILQGSVKNTAFLPFLHYVAGQNAEDMDSKTGLKKRGSGKRISSSGSTAGSGSGEDPFRTPISKTVSTDPVVLIEVACEQIHTLVLELIEFSVNSGALQLIRDLVKHLSYMGDSSKLLYLDILRGLIQTFMPYSSLTDDLFLSIEAAITPYPSLREQFYNNEYTEYSLEIAGSHFPLDMVPYLKLQTLASGPEIYQNLSNFPYTTVRIPHTFSDYNVSGNNILLLSDFCIIEPRHLDRKGGIYIPRDTQGTRINIASEKNELVVAFNYRDNKWPFIFRKLENAVENIDQPASFAEFDTIVNLLTNAISQTSISQLHDLISISHETMAYGDLIQLVFKALDRIIEQKRLSSAILCVSLLNELVPSVPERIWSGLYRSKMLSEDGRGGLLETVLGTVELVKCDYSFTVSMINLMLNLVNGTLTTVYNDQISGKARSAVLKSIVSYLMSIYESHGSWRYYYPIQRTEISSKIVDAFTVIVTACFNIDFGTPLADRVTSVFTEVCIMILRRFLDTTDTSIRATQPFFRAIETFSSKSWSSNFMDVSIYYSEDLLYTSAVLNFCSLLVRIRQLQELTPSMLEDKLFRLAPTLVDIFDLYPTLRPSVARMFDALVAVPWSGSSSPSLLAFLGPAHSYIFSNRINMVLDSVLESDAILNSTYFISSVISGKQEGFTIFLVTGKQRVGEISGQNGPSVNVDVPVMKALEQVAVKHNGKNDFFESELLAPILDVLCLAHSSWNGSPYNQEDLYLALVETIFEYSLTNKLHSGPTPTTPEAYSEMSLRSRITARAMQIIAIQLYKSPKENWVTKLFEKLLGNDSLSKISENSLNVRDFRQSLHINVHKNFESKYEGLNLSMFSRSDLQRRGRYDISSIYDLRILDIILGSDPFWATGYRQDVIDATLNLQYVESQFLLIEGWCTMLNVLASVAADADDTKFLDKLQEIQKMAIDSVAQNDMSVTIFAEANMRRLKLAYYIMMLLSKKNLLKTSLDSLNQVFNLVSQSINDIVTSPSMLAANHDFYLTTLKILNLQLSSLDSKNTNNILPKAVSTTKNKEEDNKRSLIIQGIVDMIAIKGMKLVCRAAQSDPKMSYTDDIMVTTLILRQCLDIPGSDIASSAWVFSMTETEGFRAVMSLFSTCMTRSFKDVDAHYGELTLLYLQEWLRIEPMADHFINLGLLRVLYDSPVSRMLQRGSVDLQDVKYRRLWRSTLGLVIALIRQLNGLILPDMITWINLFSAQMNQVLTLWNDVPRVSFALIEETSQILLIIYLIRRLCESENSDLMTRRLSKDLIVDVESMLSQVDFLLDHRQFLEEQIALLTVEEQQKYGKEKEKSVLVDDVVQELRDLRDLIVQISKKLQPT